MFKRITSVILLLSMLLCVCACSSKDEKDDESSVSTSGLTGDETDYLSTLRKMDDEGKEFRILVTTQLERFYNQNNASSVVVDNAAYKRNQMVNELFNTNIVYTVLDGNASGSAAFSTEISTTTMSGQGSYDLVVGQNYYTLPLVSDNMFHNLKDSDTFNWDAEWYHQNINEGGTINGNLWGASGSFVTSQLAYAMACFYSKTVYEKNNFEYDLYDLVRKGNWTYEVFLELCTAFDNTGVDEGNATYAAIRHDHAAIGMFIAMGVEFVSKDAKGNWTFNEFYDSAFEDIYEKIRALYNDYPSVMLNSSETKIPRNSMMGQTLFVQTLVDAILTDELLMANDKFTIGILPMPKLNEEQDNYRTRVMRDELFLIPITADLERSALVTEALNYVTWDIVNEAYWETALELRSSDTEDDMEMLGIIANTVYKDTAQYFNEDLLKLTSQVGLKVMDNEASFATWWARNKKALNRQLAAINTTYGQ